MKNLLLVLLLCGSTLVEGFLSSYTYQSGFSVLRQDHVSCKGSRLHALISKLYSSSKSEEGENENVSKENEQAIREPTASELLELQSKSFTTEPAQRKKRMDPLMASLTRIDPSTESNAPKVEVPILGEVSIDGSLVVVIPTVIIAVLGFVVSVQIAIQSKDEIVQTLAEVNTVLSKPPQARVTVVDPNKCRGLCSDQQQQLESLRQYMKGITGQAGN